MEFAIAAITVTVTEIPRPPQSSSEQPSPPTAAAPDYGDSAPNYRQWVSLKISGSKFPRLVLDGDSFDLAGPAVPPDDVFGV